MWSEGGCSHRESVCCGVMVTVSCIKAHGSNVSSHVVHEASAVSIAPQYNLGPQASEVDSLREGNWESVTDHIVNSLGGNKGWV